MSTGKFHIYKTNVLLGDGAQRGEWYYVVKARNGEVLVTSETFTTKANARKSIRSLRKAAFFGTVVEHL